MMQELLEDAVFEDHDFTTAPLPARQLEYCSFLRCRFAGTDFSDTRWLACRFEDCDLSNAQLSDTSFTDVTFENCKMLGLRFDQCNSVLFSAAFKGCVLDYSSFFQRQLQKTGFQNCSLQEVDFTEADLTGAVFDGADLSRAVFFHTKLAGADFSTAHGFEIDPEQNHLRKAKFNGAGLEGLLKKYGLVITG